MDVSRMLNMNLYPQSVFIVGDMGMWKTLAPLRILKLPVKRRIPRRKWHRSFKTRPRLTRRRSTRISGLG
ncbi:hypothetical protein Gorai_001946 [Gossypium raimondii]|uniref:Uncharacterized protein n=1 Tax=Gossypium raimondii TaxID=29730 RepID=A0A7J8QRA4_GOSRA|nr:hypothetical protein [Gossypium raimondii]